MKTKILLSLALCLILMFSLCVPLVSAAPAGQNATEDAAQHQIVPMSAGALEYVQGFYTYALRRVASASELSYWVWQLDSGAMAAGQMTEHILTAPGEYLNLSPSNDQFIDHVYRIMLGREPDAPGKHYWAGMLNGGSPKDYMVRHIRNTDEFRARCMRLGILP